MTPDEKLREDVARIVDPEAFGLPPTDVGEWDYLTDRDMARARADAAIALIRPAALKEAAEQFTNAVDPELGHHWLYPWQVKRVEAAILSLLSPDAEKEEGR